MAESLSAATRRSVSVGATASIPTTSAAASTLDDASARGGGPCAHVGHVCPRHAQAWITRVTALLTASLMALGPAWAAPPKHAPQPESGAPGSPAPDSDAPPTTPATSAEESGASNVGPDARAADPAGDSAAADAKDVAISHALEVTLPCGLRVVAAQDASLPVAAVVMAYEVGTEDDPKEFDGLVHALAYHLQMGGRDLAPGDAVGGIADVGGWASMAVGSAQVRFASLVPDSHLERAIWIESERARAPTTDDKLFKRALGQARGDGPLPGGVPRAALAAAWRRTSLQSSGRKPSAALSRMDNKALAAALAEHFELRAATLVIVSARPPAESIALARKTFSDLPAQPRRRRTTPAPDALRGQAPGLLAGNTAMPATAGTPDTSSGGVNLDEAAKTGVIEGVKTSGETVALPPPSEVIVERAQGGAFVWPLAPTPSAIHWGQVLCDALGAQTRAKRQGSAAAAGGAKADGAKPVEDLRCRVDADPRRPAILLRLGRGGPASLDGLRERLKSLREAELSMLVASANQRLRRQRARLDTSLGLAVELALGDPTGPASIGEPASLRSHWLDLVHGSGSLTALDGPTVLTEMDAALPQVWALEGYILTTGRSGPPVKTAPARGSERCDPVNTPGGCP